MTGETASPPPPIEFVRPPDLRECAEHTHATFGTALWSSLGEGIEERYLAEEYYQDEEQPTSFELASVSAAMFNSETIGEDVKTLASEGRLAELERNAKDMDENWGETMMEVAASLGLARETTLTPDDEATWKIYPADDGTPLLVASVNDRNLSVRLDAMYERDPQAVQENIRAYHRAKLLQNLGLHLQAANRHHELSTEDVVPDFVRQMAALSPAEQAMAQLEIHTLMSLFAQSTEIVVSSSMRVVHFIDALIPRRQPYVPEVLRHMSQCPTQPENVRQWATSVYGFYNRLTKMNYRNRPLHTLTEAQETYLRYPYIYLPGNAEEAAAAYRQKAAIKKAFAEFITSAHETSDPDTFIATLQTALPDLYQRYERFKDAVNDNAISTASLGGILKRAASRVMTSREDPNIEAHLSEFERQLNMNVRSIGSQQPDISRQGRNGPLQVQGEDLRMIIALLQNKHARIAAETKLPQGTALTREYTQEKLDKLKIVELELIQKYREKETQDVARAEQAIENGRAAEAARRSLDISDEENVWLAQILEEADHNNPLDVTLFNAVLFTLLAEKQGLIRDLNSPIVQSFIREYLKDPYGQLSPERSNKLQELGWI